MNEYCPWSGLLGRMVQKVLKRGCAKGVASVLVKLSAYPLGTQFWFPIVMPGVSNSTPNPLDKAIGCESHGYRYYGNLINIKFGEKYIHFTWSRIVTP